MRIPTPGSVLLLVLVATVGCQNASSTRAGEEVPDDMRTHRPVAFPRQSPNREAVYEALIEGRLVVDDGCLRVDTPQGERFLVLWPPRAELQGEAARVVDHETGAGADIGGRIRLSGGEVSLKPHILDRLENPPPEWCPGPYWLSGNILVPAP